MGERLRGNLGLVLTGRAELSKSLTQFSDDGWGSFPPFFTWGQTMVEVMRIMAPPSKGPMMHCYTQCPQPCSRPQLTHTSVKGSWTLTASLGQSLVGVTAPFSWVLCTQGFVCALQEPVSPVLCKLWRLYGGVDSNLLQAGLCHTQVCCTQSP